MYYERPPRRNGLLSYFVVALIAAIIGGVISIYIAPNYIYGKVLPLPGIYEDEIPKERDKINIMPTDEISAVEAVAKKTMSSVVGITTVQVQREFIWEKEVEGVGSGVVVHPDGYILTNSHVIAGGKAKRINVLFENGDKISGEVLWHDPALDLAIVKVNKKGLDTAGLGDSDSLEVGQLAVAIGNPLGLDFQRTVTSGVVSGLNRSVRVNQYNVIEDLIQTDASINPGNSGGPLLNNKGEVIGINTVKISSQMGEGLGFAIPINIAKPIIDEVIEKGDFKTVFIGFAGTEVEQYERQLGVDLSIDSGVVVIEVQPNSPAQRADIRPGDVIIKIDDQDVESMNQLQKILYRYKKGDSATLTIIRNGEEMKVQTTFTEVK